MDRFVVEKVVRDFTKGKYNGRQLDLGVNKYNKELLFKIRDGVEKIEMCRSAIFGCLSLIRAQDMSNTLFYKQYMGIRGNLFSILSSLKKQSYYYTFVDKALLTYKVTQKDIIVAFDISYKNMCSRYKNFEDNIVPEYLSYCGFKNYCDYAHSKGMSIIESYSKFKEGQPGYTEGESAELHSVRLGVEYRRYLEEFCKKNNIKIESPKEALSARLQAYERRKDISIRDRANKLTKDIETTKGNYVCPCLTTIGYCVSGINPTTKQPFETGISPLSAMTDCGSREVIIPIVYKYYHGRMISNFIIAYSGNPTKSLRNALYFINDEGGVKQLEELQNSMKTERQWVEGIRVSLTSYNNCN